MMFRGRDLICLVVTTSTIEPVCCMKRQRKVQTKKLVRGIGDILMKVLNDTKLVLKEHE